MKNDVRSSPEGLNYIVYTAANSNEGRGRAEIRSGLLRRCLEFVYIATAYLAAAAVVLVFTIMVGAAMFRALDLPTRGTNDMVAWLSAAAAFFGMAHTFKNGDLVRVGFLIDKLHSKGRRFIEILSLATAAAFVTYMTFWAAKGAWESYTFGQLADGLIAMPMWIPQSSFVVGSVALWIAIADELFLVLSGHRPTYEVLAEQRRAAGDFSSEV